jgi:hypothetical protein
MTNRKALRLIHSTQPRTLDHINLLFPDLKQIGNGATRTVYSIPNTDLVVKVENEWTKQWNGNNNKREYDSCCLLQKHPKIRRYLPSIYYYNYHLIVMRRYQLMTPVIKAMDKYTYERTESDDKLIDEYATEVCKLRETIQLQTIVTECDVHETNLGRDHRGNLRVIDLGNFWIDKAEE